MDVDEDSVKYFFSKEEWNSLSVYEKKRFANVKKNYERLQSIGIKAKIPDFLLHRKREATPPCIDKEEFETESLSHSKEQADELETESQTHSEEQAGIKPAIENGNSSNLPVPEEGRDSDSDSDIECAEFEGFKIQTYEYLSNGENSPDELDESDSSDRKRILGKKSKDRLSLLIKATQKNYDQFETQMASLRNELSETKINITNDVHRRYPKRKVRRVCYTEEEVSSEDDYFYCDDCNREYDGPCPDHGPFVHVLDRKVPKGSGPNRARDTRPRFLSVCQSGIRGAGLGVWAEADLPMGLMFGPYEGTIIKTKKEAQNSGYAWEIRRRGKVSHYLQGSDSSISNWLRFVNCAPTEDRQNMLAFQYKGRIYYRTYKRILAHTELLVWYGDEFGKDLGLCLNEELENQRGTNIKHIQKISCEEEKEFKKGACMSVSKKKNINASRCRNSSYSMGTKRYTGSGLLHIQKFECDKRSDDKRISKARENMEEHVYTESKGLKANASDLQTIPVKACSEMDAANLLKSKQAEPSEIERARLQSGDCTTQCENLTFNTEHSSVYQRNIVKNDIETNLFKCQDCNFETTTSRRLKLHIESLHLNKRPYKCQHCDYRAHTASHLRKHIDIVHLQKRPQKCQHCDFRAQTASNLRRHIDALHLQKRPQKCQHCDFRAQTTSCLRRHIDAVHLQKRPHKCQHCDFRAKTASCLRRHINAVHLQKRPHKCQHCDFRAKTAFCLRRHIDAVHLQKRPHKCQHCDFRAKTESYLRSHIDAVHLQKRPHKCQHCDFRAKTASCLQTHINRKHSIPEIT